MPILTQPAFGPRTSLAYITVGTLMDVWTAVWYFTLIRPEGLGMGDVKLAVLLGAGLGRDVVWGITLGFLAVWPVALYLVLRHGRVGLKQMIPFAPLLALGSLVVLFSAGPTQ